MIPQITEKMNRYVIKPERSILLTPPDFEGSTFNTKTAIGYVAKYINRAISIPYLPRGAAEVEQTNPATIASNAFSQYSLFSSFM